MAMHQAKQCSAVADTEDIFSVRTGALLRQSDSRSHENRTTAQSADRTGFHKVNIGISQFCLYLLLRHHGNIPVSHDWLISQCSRSGSEQAGSEYLISNPNF